MATSCRSKIEKYEDEDEAETYKEARRKMKEDEEGKQGRSGGGR